MVTAERRALLVQRLQVLEARLPESVARDVAKLESLLQNHPVTRLYELLQVCSISVASPVGPQSDGGTQYSREEKKEIVLAHHDEMIATVSMAEQLVSDYEPLLSRLATVTAPLLEAAANTDTQAVLHRYELLLARFHSVVLRLMVLLQRTVVQRHDQKSK